MASATPIGALPPCAVVLSNNSIQFPCTVDLLNSSGPYHKRGATAQKYSRYFDCSLFIPIAALLLYCQQGRRSMGLKNSERMPQVKQCHRKCVIIVRFSSAMNNAMGLFPTLYQMPSDDFTYVFLYCNKMAAAPSIFVGDGEGGIGKNYVGQIGSRADKKLAFTFSRFFLITTPSAVLNRGRWGEMAPHLLNKPSHVESRLGSVPHNQQPPMSLHTIRTYCIQPYQQLVGWKDT